MQKAMEGCVPGRNTAYLKKKRRKRKGR